VPLIDGGSVRLPELIGLSRALDLIITGRMIEAKEAMQMGLVNRVTKGQLISEGNFGVLQISQKVIFCKDFCPSP
jgi:enoyl-CoA hydratase/carnithine racemase